MDVPRAGPLTGGTMARARWTRRQDAEREMNQVFGTGLTPRSQDAVRDIRRGKPGR